MNVNVKENKFLATVWFVLSFLIASLSIYVLFTPGKFLFINLLGFSVLLLLIGCQRLEKYQLENERYNKAVRYLSLFVCFTSVLFLSMNSKL